MTFEELDLSDEVLDALYDMNFEECTPIQEQSIPYILQGRDLIAVAQTGTGKTAAYLLPIISRLYTDGAPTDAINCIVMAPTRELAQQIDRQMEGMAYYLPVSSIAVYGGTDGATFAHQQNSMKAGADVVIATPGRLLAHMQMGVIDLSRVSFFVLDEADRMLDMGFYDDIMQIVRCLSKERQTLMFSATMPPKIKKLAEDILRDPAEVKIAVSRPADGIDQSAYVCHERQKTPILLDLLRKDGGAKRVIIFASSKLKVKDLTRQLKQARLNVAQIHSDLDQHERDEVMLGFRAGRIDILVATDIVARGIDIDDITMVVNYDVPYEAEDYVHRIGRTARAGSQGRAITMVSTMDQPRFGQIEKFLGKPVRKEPVAAEYGEAPEYRPDRKVDVRGNRGGGGGRRGKNGGRPKDNPSKAKGGAGKPAREDKPKAQAADGDAKSAQKRGKKPFRRHRGGGKGKGGAAGSEPQNS